MEYFIFRVLFGLCFVLIYYNIVASGSIDREHDNFEVNGYYLDDILTYSPARLDTYLNSTSSNFTAYSADAHRPMELQCPSMNVITTRYRCKVRSDLNFWENSLCYELRRFLQYQYSSMQKLLAIIIIICVFYRWENIGLIVSALLVVQGTIL